MVVVAVVLGVVLLTVAIGVALAARARRRAALPPSWVRPLRVAIDQTATWPCGACHGRVSLGDARNAREELDLTERVVRRMFGAVCERCGAIYHITLAARGGSPVVVEAALERIEVT